MTRRSAHNAVCVGLVSRLHVGIQQSNQSHSGMLPLEELTATVGLIRKVKVTLRDLYQYLYVKPPKLNQLVSFHV